ncbi:hypothetical protein RIF29_33128 [Crotalaria pallida]|uniref:Uncharacterized protein n=1 Tax=Crotalaria pallida TaxID=3830 RepID=A0AAN9HTW2_CROPI
MREMKGSKNSSDLKRHEETSQLRKTKQPMADASLSSLRTVACQGNLFKNSLGTGSPRAQQLCSYKIGAFMEHYLERWWSTWEHNGSAETSKLVYRSILDQKHRERGILNLVIGIGKFFFLNLSMYDVVGSHTFAPAASLGSLHPLQVSG